MILPAGLCISVIIGWELTSWIVEHPNVVAIDIELENTWAILLVRQWTWDLYDTSVPYLVQYMAWFQVLSGKELSSVEWKTRLHASVQSWQDNYESIICEIVACIQ